MTITLIRRYRLDLAALVMLMLIAGAIRFGYQHSTVVDNPLRADASRYFFTAFNIREYGIHSLEKPSGAHPPLTRTDLPPGYPLFLSVFMEGNIDIDQYIQRVVTSQAILGIGIVVLTYLIARLSMGVPGAFFAGLLVACCPHLVALENFLLTETLFTFLLVMGVLLIGLGWRHGRWWLILPAGIVLAASFQVRAVTLLLIPALAPLLMVSGHHRGWLPRRTAAVFIACFVIGWIGIFLARKEYDHLMVSRIVAASKALQGNAAGSDSTVTTVDVDSLTAGDGLSRVHNPLAYLNYYLPPPQFWIDRQSHIMRDHRNNEYKQPTAEPFAAHPMAYLTWNLGGKSLLLWNWDNAYNGDIAFYPLINNGFEERPVLRALHRTMKFLHWPLLLLALTGIVTVAIRWIRGTLPDRSRLLAIPTVAIIYALSLHQLAGWLPRYSVPWRPFAYILAVATLGWLVGNLRYWLFGAPSKTTAGGTSRAARHRTTGKHTR